MKYSTPSADVICARSLCGRVGVGAGLEEDAGRVAPAPVGGEAERAPLLGVPVVDMSHFKNMGITNSNFSKFLGYFNCFYVLSHYVQRLTHPPKLQVLYDVIVPFGKPVGNLTPLRGTHQHAKQ